MNLLRSALAGLLALSAVATASAQTFPTVPDHTVIGRIGTGTGSGPSQAIPFATLQSQLGGNQSANTVLAGPTSGGAALAAFRALIAADLPNSIPLTKFATLPAFNVIGNNSAATALPAAVPMAAISAKGSANVSGSGQNTTGIISSSSPNLTLANAKDFANGQGIRIDHAGAAFTPGAPTSLAVTPNGSTGATTYHYSIESIDAAGGSGAAVTVVTIANGNATLSTTNFNALTWAAGSGSPTGYAVFSCTSTTVASCTTLLAIVGGTAFNDTGVGARTAPDWLPSAANASAVADWLVTSVSSGGGTTALTLANNATTTCTSTNCPVYHDDTVALQAALTAAQNAAIPFDLGLADYYISAALTCGTGPCHVYGAGMYQGSNIHLASPAQFGFAVTYSGAPPNFHDLAIFGNNGTVFNLSGSLIDLSAAAGRGARFASLFMNFGATCISTATLNINIRLLDASCSQIVVSLTTPGDSVIEAALSISPFSVQGWTGAVGIAVTGDAGGTKIVHNKINSQAASRGVQINHTSANDGDVVIANNSIEGWSVSCIQVFHTGAVSLKNIQINDNQCQGVGNGSSPIIDFPDTTTGVSNIIVTNNILAGTASGVNFGSGVSSINATGNLISSATTGFTVGANVTNCTIAQNTYVSVTTAVSDSSGTCIFGTRAPIGFNSVTAIAQASTVFVGASAQNANGANTQALTPVAGTFRNLFVQSAAPAAGQTITVALMINGSASTLTCTITGTGTTCNDTAHAPTIAAGQAYTLRAITSATTGSIGNFSAGVEFDAGS